MNVCDYYDRLSVERGKLVRIVMANARKKSESYKKLDVYKEYESGKCVCRNLYTSMTGYRVGFPNEVNSLYRNGSCSFFQKLDKWGECNKMMSMPSRTLVDVEREMIVKKYPGFKYVLEKWNGSIDKTLQVLRIWKEHKEIEIVLAAGFERIALNKAFWRLSEAKRKRVAAFLRNNQDKKRITLLDVQLMLNKNISYQELEKFKAWSYENLRAGYDIYKYLQRIGKADIGGVLLYRDYQDLLAQTEHDSKVDYWKWPKDLRKKHDILREEVARINAIKDMEKLKEKQAKYFNAVKKLLKNDYEIGGYRVFVPATVEEIQKQASALHQCLIQCDYVSQVIDKKCVLVFVQKDGAPIATAQILARNKIGQFYADELDRKNCLPTDEVRAVVNKWIEMKRNAA